MATKKATSKPAAKPAKKQSAPAKKAAAKPAAAVTAPKPPAADTPAALVARYLTMLTNPDALIDPTAGEALRAELETETDVLKKAKLLSALERAEQIDETTITGGFITHAAGWAAAEQVTVGALRQLGVPADVLTAAGLAATNTSPRAATPRPATKPAKTAKTAPVGNPGAGGTGSARKRVTRADVIAAMPAGFFTLSELTNKTGASTLTVRSAVDDLVAAGKLTQHDPDPNYHRRGKPPRRYKKA